MSDSPSNGVEIIDDTNPTFQPAMKGIIEQQNEDCEDCGCDCDVGDCNCGAIAGAKDVLHNDSLFSPVMSGFSNSTFLLYTAKHTALSMTEDTSGGPTPT